MEPREPARIASAEARPAESEPGEDAARPFARPSRNRSARRPAITRLSVAMVAALALVVLLACCGAWLVRSLVAWLHSQPEYQLAFRDIELDPPPPAWIKSGRAGLLEQVRSKSGEPEWLSVLEVDLERIERDFKLHSPWVARVVRVERAHPNRLVVRLDYREPVAHAAWDSHSSIVVDNEAVLLPIDDLDLAAAGPLILLAAKDPPSDPRPGCFWAAGELAQPDPAIAASAKLAAFLKPRQSRPGSPPPRWRIVAIHPSYTGGLTAQTSDNTQIVWGDAPGDEAPGGLTADQKWSQIRDWFESPGAPSVKWPDYLYFSQNRLRRHNGGRPVPD